jgi:hypothetical protein
MKVPKNYHACVEKMTNAIKIAALTEMGKWSEENNLIPAELISVLLVQCHFCILISATKLIRKTLKPVSSADALIDSMIEELRQLKTNSGG